MPFNNVQQTGGSVTIKDEGVTIASAASSIDFAGAGVSGAAVGSAVTETISGAAATFEVNETLTNTGNDIDFTFANTPSEVFVVWIVENGQVLSDYTVVGDTLTLGSALPGFTLKASYTH